MVTTIKCITKDRNTIPLFILQSIEQHIITNNLFKSFLLSVTNCIIYTGSPALSKKILSEIAKAQDDQKLLWVHLKTIKLSDDAKTIVLMSNTQYKPLLVNCVSNKSKDFTDLVINYTTSNEFSLLGLKWEEKQIEQSQAA